MPQTEPDPALVSSIEQAIMCGLLFQRHPDHDNWETTRPGARPGEVAAFVHKPDNSRKSYISVCYRREGEEEAGSTYEWTQDCYEIIGSRGDGTQYRDVSTDVSRAAELVAIEMERVAQ